MTRKTMNKFLTLGLTNPSHLVRALSLTGLSSVLMQPKKVREAPNPGGLSAGGGVWEKASVTAGGGQGSRPAGEGCSV